MSAVGLGSLSKEDCLQRLRAASVGRIAFQVDDCPVIVPVNYRLVDPASGPLIAVRTRPGSLVAEAPTSVAFEIDGADPVHHEGWSVLVRGELVHATPISDDFRARYDPQSWLADADAWLLIDPWSITGRELHASEPIWQLRVGEYL